MTGKPKEILTNPLTGFMELLPAEQIVFNTMFRTIQRNYETFGFVPLDTPVLERADVLLAKAGGETEKQIYRFTKGDADLAMRFDLTVPLARFVANNYGKLTFPYRRYAMGKVYRGERPQAGRFREFYQCDIDIIGDGDLNLRYDAEIPSVIYNIFRELGFERFTIRINNRKIFNGLFEGLGIADKAAAIMQSIDRLEKIGKDEVIVQLQALDLKMGIVEKLFQFLELAGTNDEILAGLRNLPIPSKTFAAGIAELAEVTSLISKLGVPSSNFQIDLTIARGLDYYTGTVYETRLDDFPDIGSVCSGGRYDDLASYYIDRKLPGVGISLGLTRLFDQLMKRQVLQPGASTTTKVLVVPMMEDLAASLKIATSLREAGIPTEVSFIHAKKTEKHLKYATRLGIPYAIFVGEDEVQKQRFGLKDLSNRCQKELDLNGIIDTIWHSPKHSPFYHVLPRSRGVHN